MKKKTKKHKNLLDEENLLSDHVRIYDGLNLH